jgi:hypothetical protein
MPRIASHCTENEEIKKDVKRQHLGCALVLSTGKCEEPVKPGQLTLSSDLSTRNTIATVDNQINETS